MSNRPMTASEVLYRNRRHDELLELEMRSTQARNNWKDEQIARAFSQEPGRTRLTNHDFHTLICELRAIDPFGPDWYDITVEILKKHIEVKP